MPGMRFQTNPMRKGLSTFSNDFRILIDEMLMSIKSVEIDVEAIGRRLARSRFENEGQTGVQTLTKFMAKITESVQLAPNRWYYSFEEQAFRRIPDTTEFIPTNFEWYTLEEGRTGTALNIAEYYNDGDGDEGYGAQVGQFIGPNGSTYSIEMLPILTPALVQVIELTWLDEWTEPVPEGEGVGASTGGPETFAPDPRTIPEPPSTDTGTGAIVNRYLRKLYFISEPNYVSVIAQCQE